MKNSDIDKQRAWCQARVAEAGSVQAAKPDEFTQRAWVQLCRHLGVSAKPAQARTLEEALSRVAELAR